jgi:hypothetical protein
VARELPWAMRFMLRLWTRGACDLHALPFVLMWKLYAGVPDLQGTDSGFTTLPPVLLQEQPAVVLLLEGPRLHKMLVIREYGGHEDLRGSGRRSVIPYIHG